MNHIRTNYLTLSDLDFFTKILTTNATAIARSTMPTVVSSFGNMQKKDEKFTKSQIICFLIERVVLFSMPIQELKEIIGEVIEEKLKEFRSNSPPPIPPPKEYISSKEVCQMLHISMATLWSYSKYGKLKKYRIGGRILSRTEEVRNAVINDTMKIEF
jgi:predicted DNA-binding transcriptional regulator AlpA